MKTWMSTPSQPYAGFLIESNGDNFHSRKFSSIDTMLIGDNPNPAMLSEM